MKLLESLHFLLLCAFASSLWYTTEYDRQFDEFKAKFNKTYRNRFEEFLAKIYFRRSLEYTERQNRNSTLAFELAVNQFSDQNPEIIKNLTSLNVRPPPMVNGRTFSYIDPTNYPQGPESVDWTQSGCVTPVKDQYYFCNACYAYSGVAALEAQWCLKNNVSVTMSEQQVIDCSNGFSGNKGCGGGTQGAAYLHIQTVTYGIESDTTYPFAEYEANPPRRPCKFDRSRSVAVTSGYQRIRSTNEDMIANVVAKNGPVSAAMNGGIPSFWYYSSGIYNDVACTPSMSHSVLIVGYGVDYSTDPPMPYWLCKNSWWE
jgi:C1A family cysteine protease